MQRVKERLQTIRKDVCCADISYKAYQAFVRPLDSVCITLPLDIYLDDNTPFFYGIPTARALRTYFYQKHLLEADAWIDLRDIREFFQEWYRACPSWTLLELSTPLFVDVC